MADTADTYKKWWGIAAGGDRDGVGGLEAANFFGRSGLDQATLSQVSAPGRLPEDPEGWPAIFASSPSVRAPGPRTRAAHGL